MKKAVLIVWLAGLFEPAMMQTGVEPTRTMTMLFQHVAGELFIIFVHDTII